MKRNLVVFCSRIVSFSSGSSLFQTEKRRGGSFLQKVGSLRRSNKSSKRERPHPTAGITISGPTLVQSTDMEERMQRLGCVDINSKKQQEDEFNNNTKLLRSASADGATGCYCDTCSIDSIVTDYRLPSDYVLGTFPKELLEVQSSTASTVCTHQSTDTNSRLVPRTQSNLPTKSANRNSYYDNIENEDEIDEVLPVNTAPQTEARKELDAVLQDLLINMCSLDIGDEEDASDFLKLYLNSSSKQTKSSHLNIDSAIVSPTSEDLSSFTDTPSESATTPIDTPELKRTSDRTARAADVTTSSEELADNDLSGSHEDIAEETTADQPGETVWRERRDSGVGSSLTREPT